MKSIALPLLALCIMHQVSAQVQQQSIVYQWLNQPCSDMLNCDNGCSACNIPAGGNGVLMGTNVAWIGVSTCPQPILPGDNVVFTTGWPAAADNEHYLIFSGIAAAPMRIDSLIINHTSATNGPSRLKVEFTSNVAMPLEEIGDMQVPPTFEDQVFTDLGGIVFPEGSEWGSFQVRITPYLGWGEGWAVNEVRVVATPADPTMGITQVGGNRVLTTAEPLFDVMGRRVAARRTGEEPAHGVYVGEARRVQVF